MTIASGQVVTAEDLNNLKSHTHTATQTADVSGSVTDADLTGCTMNITTRTDNAKYFATAFCDMDHSASVSTPATVSLVVDGVDQSGEAVYQQGTASANDRMTPGGVWEGTIATAGVHTFKLTATIPANITCHQTNTKLQVTIEEVV